MRGKKLQRKKDTERQKLLSRGFATTSERKPLKLAAKRRVAESSGKCVKRGD